MKSPPHLVDEPVIPPQELSAAQIAKDAEKTAENIEAKAGGETLKETFIEGEVQTDSSETEREIEVTQIAPTSYVSGKFKLKKTPKKKKVSDEEDATNSTYFAKLKKFEIDDDDEELNEWFGDDDDEDHQDDKDENDDKGDKDDKDDKGNDDEDGAGGASNVKSTGTRQVEDFLNDEQNMERDEAQHQGESSSGTKHSDLHQVILDSIEIRKNSERSAKITFEMSSQNSGTSSAHSRNSCRERRPSIEATLVHYVMALREALDEMTPIEEVLIDRINYLTVGLENSFQEINLLHQRLNILVTPPMEAIIPQGDWNLAQGVINPTGWDGIPTEPPLDNL
ncbi:transcription initiation factor TFIID subunit 11-like [Helianthus annuus]|uniref:transcription initiation factor TFIID subunit 11-like n=1 Tax=Helianthus annuus TaxID=4232 RepID=UPI000B8EF4E1|nr:transcription initiation factor TFIID subunit 11-like [Helianthus annuus]